VEGFSETFSTRAAILMVYFSHGTKILAAIRISEVLAKSEITSSF